ncbi:hypothetical protein AVEN_174094-1 [Araneus ventricosus]|uniref:Uncharacterized protein n=1 Tax=Araneus ventricosus TaxID=182803 RepID=A0A4Y2C1N2_ARAVE|nr:hypothetical protein AVEN_174094-1 [Araneus ventricosus]
MLLENLIQRESITIMIITTIIMIITNIMTIITMSTTTITTITIMITITITIITSITIIITDTTTIMAIIITMDIIIRSKADRKRRLNANKDLQQEHYELSKMFPSISVSY